MWSVSDFFLLLMFLQAHIWILTFLPKIAKKFVTIARRACGSPNVSVI